MTKKYNLFTSQHLTSCEIQNLIVRESAAEIKYRHLNNSGTKKNVQIYSIKFSVYMTSLNSHVFLMVKTQVISNSRAYVSMKKCEITFYLFIYLTHMLIS